MRPPLSRLRGRLAPGLASCAIALVACNTPTKNGASSDRRAALTTTQTAASSSPFSATPDSEATSRHLKIIEAPPETDALSLIRAKRLEAKSESRVLVVYVGATWCEPCRKFRAEMMSGRLDDRFGRTTLLTFDVDKDMERLGAADYTFKFVPFVALPGADGRPADSQQATGKGSDAWRELLGKLDTWQRGS